MWGQVVQRSSSGLAYRRAGTGVPVILLHGVPGCGAAWQKVAGCLPGSLDVIVPDLLGFGDSDRRTGLEALHARAQAAAVGALVDELGIAPVVIVGHDFGGPTAITFAGVRPQDVSAIGLLATNVFGDTPIPFPLSLVTWPLVGSLGRRLVFSRRSLAVMLRRASGLGRTAPDPDVELGDDRQVRAIGTIFAGSLMNLAELYGPLEAQLAGVAAPIFVGWGDHDPFFPLSSGHRTARAARTDLRVYPGAGHFLPHERPDEVAADIAALAERARRQG